MVWERLRVFAAVAEHGSVGAAAGALHITGPAVTQQIRKLERETHTRLVEPDGRGIRLTAAGHVLASSAARIATTVAEAERDLATIHGQIVGPLRIGVVASALRALLPDVLRTLTTEHPRLVPTVRDGEVVDLLPALRARDLDAVVLESWSHRPARIPPGVRVTTLVTEPVLLAVPSGHPVADRALARLDELTGEIWASCPDGTEAYEGLVQLLRALNVEPDVRYLAADFATQLRLVAAGLAVAAVPGIATDPPPEGVRFLPCEPALSRTLAVAVREQDDLPSLRALVDALRDAAAQLVPGRARIPSPGQR
ncbi:LysR family transcriptional regulator [Pseudonocardia sp. KRD291]|uniref:LysR family transcriptional regulator n=1 Tax=Pseudonocardia sp. KRD291 TaxID=2792007 RepID=UPI001CF79648|nr:LysR family transcriptional regulator [Pseudonocardia sp. KRD291]